MAGISKKTIKKDGKTTVKYTITYRDIYGKQHTSGLYDKKADAKKDLPKFENIKATSNNNITLGELINVFMEKAERKFAKNTIKAYKSYRINYLLPIEGIKYKSLNLIMLQEFFDEIETKKAYTAHNVLIFCQGAINYCIQKKIIPEYNIFNDIDRIKRPNRNLHHLTFEQIVKVLNHCKKTRPEHYALLFFLLGSGARIGEAVALEKTDFIKNCIYINKQFTANELKNKPKTDKSVRKIFLFPLLTETIQEHIKTIPPNCRLLFPNKNGNYINPNNFRKRFWKPLLKECGINERIRLHDLRGSYTDLVLSSGISGKFAQNQLGHEDSSTTFNIYAQNNQDSINSALNILEEKFKKCENNVRIFEPNPPNNIINFRKIKPKS